MTKGEQRFIKDFDGWISVKKKMDKINKLPTINEGDIWWCGSWYVGFEFLGTTQTAVVGQARVLSVSRLYNKMGQIPASDLEKVKIGFLNLYK